MYGGHGPEAFKSVAILASATYARNRGFEDLCGVFKELCRVLLGFSRLHDGFFSGSGVLLK